MNQYDRMVSQLPYKVDAECRKKMTENKKLIYKYNKLSPSSSAKKLKLIKKILGKAGSNINIEQPFHCDYGKHIFVGENFYSNYNLTILDVAKVQIGDNVMCGPNVSIYTAGHPVHYETRNTLYEYGIEIYIEDNVWIGGNSIILPGVKIAKGSVIGAGSVVTKSIPANSIAAGNPCRVLRKITDEDKEFYFQKLKFDAAIK